MKEIYETDIERKKALEEFEAYSKMNELEKRQFNLQKSSIHGIDTEAIRIGAERWEQARQDYNHKMRKLQQQREEKKQSEDSAFMKQLSDKVKEDNRLKAEQEYQEELAKKEKELKQTINQKHNVKTNEEENIDNGLRNMLSRMNLSK